MENERNHKVCYLCLTSCEGTFEYVEAVTIEILRFLGLGLDLDVSRRPVICRMCSDNLQKCYNFKTVCIYTEDCINSFRDDRNNVCLDLLEIYLKKDEKKAIVLSKCHTVCRLCMEMSEADCCVPLNDEAKDVISAKVILEKHISEMDLDIIKEPVICISCNESLYSYFNFITRCLGIQNNIKKDWEIEQTKIQPYEKSKSVLHFAAENISSYGNGYIDIPKNCEENELHDEIKLEFENMELGESQQLYIKHEFEEREEDDGVEVKKLESIVKKYHKNEENCKTELQFEQSVEIEDDRFVIKQEEIDIKTDEEDMARFQNGMLVRKNLLEVPMHSCKVCTYKAKWKSTIKHHMLIHKSASEVTMYSCEICTFKSKYRNYLKQHMSIHNSTSEVTTYPCEICTFKSKQKRYLQQHILLMHKNTSEVTMYSCETCTYKTKHKYYLNRHMLIHASEVKTYPCEICTFKSKQKGHLKQHMLIHKNASEVTLYSCEICTFKTKHKGSLKKHMLIHSNTSEATMYSCEICTFISKHKCSLKSHMLIHNNSSEVTMYSCEICTFKTKRKQNLKKHMLIHKSTSEVTMYSCEICTYKAKQKGNLKKHMLIHSNTSEVTMYSCEICTFKTKRKQNLKKHMLIHKSPSEITMYSCEICTFKTKRRQNLKKHMLIHKKK